MDGWMEGEGERVITAAVTTTLIRGNRRGRVERYIRDSMQGDNRGRRMEEL